jgi:hypothetical protein
MTHQQPVLQIFKRGLQLFKTLRQPFQFALQVIA